MKQICTFNTRPATIVNGGYKKGRYIIWLNLSVSEIPEHENQTDFFESITDRLVLSDFSINSFLEVVDHGHIAMATNDELQSIMKFFKAEKDLESWIALRSVQIDGYDTSDKVNCFFLNEIPLWLDKATRVGLVNSVSAEKRDGAEITTLWFGDIMLQLPIDFAMAALDKVELYAKTCFNITAKHLADIKKIKTLKEIKNYNITLDYPDFLKLSINA